MCEAAVGSHGSRRPRRGALFALQTCQCPPEWGVHGCNGSPPPSTPPTLGSPITEFGSEDVKQTRLQMALLFTCLRVPLPPPQHPSFTGIRSAISRSPMATAGLVNEGDNFLMMSPRHVIGGLLQRDRTRSEIQKALIFGLWNCASGYVSYNLTISL